MFFHMDIFFPWLPRRNEFDYAKHAVETLLYPLCVLGRKILCSVGVKEVVTRRGKLYERKF